MKNISTIFSIGHGNKSIEEFVNELKSHSIEFLFDIRSKPYSKWSPQFNREELQREMEKIGIKYVFSGDTLGGLPEDRSCYDRDGKVIYDVIKTKSFFITGLDKLESANNKQFHVALMCSESKPEECHRSKLIGQELLKREISLQHIVSVDKTKPQVLVMNELNKGLNTINLFGEEAEFTSRKSY